MDAERLGFANDSFDVVVAQYVVTAVPNPEAALDEFARVLRPQGEIVLTSRISAEAGMRGTLRGGTRHRDPSDQRHALPARGLGPRPRRSRAAARWRLRHAPLTAGMYHRFHAPDDSCIESVTYLGSDTWNVNPIALKRIEALFCRNERAVVRLRLDRSGDLLTMVPIAAILVAELKLGFMGQRLLSSPAHPVQRLSCI